ncbi:MAG TPA: hypothetical protein VH987_10975 [Candidatus Limnocylindria bacterium]|jgi:hypothetical protein
MDDAALETARHAFDFWLGEWEVSNPEGRVLGTNRITPLFGGLVIREEWTGVRGVQGTSLNCYAADREAWHQTWMDSTGDLLLLDGGLRDGSMVMEGTADETGHRITWTPMPETGGLRQHWETREHGAQWQTAFDGRYRRIR